MSLNSRSPEAVDALSALELARRGDLAAFEQLMRRNEPRVSSLAYRFTGRRADAEELTQDVFLALHASLAQITDEEHLKRWLLRTVTHRCLNRMRDDKRRAQLVPIETLPPDAERANYGGQADHLANAAVRRQILELSPEARAAVLLRFQEDLDPSEISVVLGMRSCRAAQPESRSDGSCQPPRDAVRSSQCQR